ncbi:SSI family serine proteinase inhibitor [Streptomyces sp. BI20]|uniref:SSI family serine proteinase inhibitor n=1 Tax=Streptomyces sp. BI20 TaxID=3403460 RepID=UPI003C77AF27
MRLAVLATAATLASALAGPLPLPLAGLFSPAPDRLTVTVSETGNPLADGTHDLTCEPVGGSHPEAAAACARLGTLAREGKNPFAPVSPRAMCTLQDGGAATAHVTGTWRGQRVDARFHRRNGCEISRWNELEPVLPGARS